MSDDQEDLTKRYDPQRRFRWTLVNSGCDSFQLRAIRSRMSSRYGLVMTVEFQALAGTDLSEMPMEGNRAILRLLDEDGDVTEEYTVEWLAAELIPFLELDYSSSEAVVQGVELRHVKVRRR